MGFSYAPDKNAASKWEAITAVVLFGWAVTVTGIGMSDPFALG